MTAASPLVSVVLGHNQFYGVNHLSSAQAAERAAHFADPARIVDVVRDANRLGAGGLMLSTHERSGPVAAAIASDRALAADLKIFPLLPYIQKYVTRANEVGMINVVLEGLQGMGMRDKLATLWSGGRGVLAKDVRATLAILMRFELKPFKGLDVPAVFLHDALTDLALAFGMKDIFEFYIAEIDRTCDAAGAFATKNLPLFLDRFAEWQLPTPVVMTHFNEVGFHMNPSRIACEEALDRHPAHVLAMGTLASGYLTPRRAYAYLGGVRGISAVVVGASSAAHLTETIAAIRENRIGA